MDTSQIQHLAPAELASLILCLDRTQPGFAYCLNQRVEQ